MRWGETKYKESNEKKQKWQINASKRTEINRKKSKQVTEIRELVSLRRTDEENAEGGKR